MNEYIDVRGAYPVYFRGFIAYRLEEESRDITIADARFLTGFSTFIKDFQDRNKKSAWSEANEEQANARFNRG